MAVVAVLVAGLVSIGLVRDAVEASARSRLAQEADLIATLRPRQATAPGARRLLGVSGLRVVFISPAGAERGPVDLPDADVSALLDGDVSALLDGEPVSRVETVDGRREFVEGRPLDTGGAVALVQVADLAPDAFRGIRRIEGIALVAGLAGGALAGVLLARRLARPLRAAAAGARRLAAGDRAVRVEPDGPAEVAEVSAALNALAGALASSERRQRDFLLSVSHELRTPLTAIRGFSESLADGVTVGDAVRPAGATMLAEAGRLERLVADLLDLARLGAADFRIDAVDVDLRAVLREAAAVWGPRCAAAGVAFAVEEPAGPVVARTDPTRVRQIVDGLAENALRVTPVGAPIVLALRREPGVAVLEVRDGGPGLTDDDLAVAFDRSALYVRYRGVRQVGTGLGLALVGALATRLGGRAAAGHAAEGGACFAVRLPA